MASIEITVAGTTDVADITRLLAKQYEEHGITLEERTMTKGVSGLVHVPSRGRALIAREDGITVGIATLSFTWTLEHGGLVVWLEELYVVPEKRNDGIGARLLDRALHIARETGCIAMELEVAESQSRAEHLYERASFTRLKRARFSRKLSPS